jgi:hypothetical protein
MNQSIFTHMRDFTRSLISFLLPIALLSSVISPVVDLPLGYTWLSVLHWWTVLNFGLPTLSTCSMCSVLVIFILSHHVIGAASPHGFVATAFVVWFPALALAVLLCLRGLQFVLNVAWNMVGAVLAMPFGSTLIIPLPSWPPH